MKTECLSFLHSTLHAFAYVFLSPSLHMQYTCRPECTNTSIHNITYICTILYMYIQCTVERKMQHMLSLVTDATWRKYRVGGLHLITRNIKDTHNTIYITILLYYYNTVYCIWYCIILYVYNLYCTCTTVRWIKVYCYIVSVLR